jgi:hypothetical protein
VARESRRAPGPRGRSAGRQRTVLPPQASRPSRAVGAPEAALQAAEANSDAADRGSGSGQPTRADRRIGRRRLQGEQELPGLSGWCPRGPCSLIHVGFRTAAYVRGSPETRSAAGMPNPRAASRMVLSFGSLTPFSNRLISVGCRAHARLKSSWDSSARTRAAARLRPKTSRSFGSDSRRVRFTPPDAHGPLRRCP